MSVENKYQSYSYPTHPNIDAHKPKFRYCFQTNYPHIFGAKIQLTDKNTNFAYLPVVSVCSIPKDMKVTPW